jgi:hypothetical protein
MQIGKLFSEHPASVGETYWQHQRVAFRFAFDLLVASLAALVHAFLPFLCVKTASRKIDHLHHRMVTHRRQQPPEAKSAQLV